MDQIIIDLEDAQRILSTTTPKKYNLILNKYLKPYNKTVADLNSTVDFIKVVGLENVQKAIDELYRE